MGFKDAGKPHYLGHRERLRRRFREAGPDALPDYELLELILFRAAPRRDTKPLAKALVARFGTFAEAVNAPEELLREVPGIGEAAITELKLVRAAALTLRATPRRRAPTSRCPPDRGRGQAARSPGPRPHYRRQAGPRQPQRPRLDLSCHLAAARKAALPLHDLSQAEPPPVSCGLSRSNISLGAA